jgi:hypothetical protein
MDILFDPVFYSQFAARCKHPVRNHGKDSTLCANWIYEVVENGYFTGFLIF